MDPEFEFEEIRVTEAERLQRLVRTTSAYFSLSAGVQCDWRCKPTRRGGIFANCEACSNETEVLANAGIR